MSKHSLFFIFFSTLLILAVRCNIKHDKSKKSSSDSLVYLNHSDTIKYIGMKKCLECHTDKSTFLETGMGQSFGLATNQKSIFSKIKKHTYTDSIGGFTYYASILNNKLTLTENKTLNNKLINQLAQTVDYVIGSGQHTNSHLINHNGYIYQMPFTFYAQKGIMDFPPGFEDGNNTRFSRKIGVECMTCHNAYPTFVQGSENKFSFIPNGIDCERCHGPGEAHLNKLTKGVITDTSKQIDYSIVNPSKLPIDLQFDVCQRCHLQGNAVLKEGKSFLDFKPGKKLEDVFTVYLPRFANADEDFIMASHADRLKQSQCFIQSNKSSDKKLKSRFTCITCHDPHVSVKKADVNYFNKKCVTCHASVRHSDKDFISVNNPKQFKPDNCTACHMPPSGSIDIPHVSIHDHYIRKPILQKEVQQLKQFVGLTPVNQKNPSKKNRLMAYLQQYEKFGQQAYYLDSIQLLLNQEKQLNVFVCERIWYWFLINDFNLIVSYVRQPQIKQVINQLNKKSLDNYDAWTLYRIGESCVKLNLYTDALFYFERCVKLAPYNLEFQYKLANVLFNVKKTNEAKTIFEFILKEDTYFVSALNGLGYLYLVENNIQQAQPYLEQALHLEPNNELVLLNNISLQVMLKNKQEIKQLIYRLKKVNPKHPKLKLLKQFV